MILRKLLVEIFTATLNFFVALISAIAWANILMGSFEIRSLLIFFGGLLIPYFDSILKKMAYFGWLTYLSALAGFVALTIDIVFISGLRALGRALWLEGNSLITINSGFTSVFFALQILGVFCMFIFFLRSHASAGFDKKI